jgi:hypothetical protein
MTKDIRNATARERFEVYEERARQLYALVGNKPTTVKGTELAAMTGLSSSIVTYTAQMLVRLGVLRYTSTRGSTSGAEWEFLTDWAGIKRALDLEMENEMRGAPSIREVIRRRTQKKRVTRKAAEKVAVTEDRLGFPVAAVAGPEAPKPLEPVVTYGSRAPEALVMAAKQYRARRIGNDPGIQQAKRLIKELESLEVPVPPDLRNRAEAAPDARLEAVVLVLPYIERLERDVAELANLRRQVNEVGPLRQQVERQRKQIEGLVSGRVADAMRGNLSSEH